VVGQFVPLPWRHVAVPQGSGTRCGDKQRVPGPILNQFGSMNLPPTGCCDWRRARPRLAASAPRT
jgi:hypothetical protein